MEPKSYYFRDDGKIPNNKLPLLVYKNANPESGEAAAEWFEKCFEEHNWKNSWRNGVYEYQHYHSNTHEVLGVYSGEAVLQLGGEKGEKVKLSQGDIVVIPAGVAHKKLKSTDFKVVGAYPDGRSQDMNVGEPDERPEADKNISAVPIPEADPLLGPGKGLCEIWKKLNE